MAAQSGGTCVLRLHYIIGPTGSIMNMMMTSCMEYELKYDKYDTHINISRLSRMTFSVFLRGI